MLYGGGKNKSAKSIAKAQRGKAKKNIGSGSTGFGGHFRAVQGFKYIGLKDA